MNTQVGALQQPHTHTPPAPIPLQDTLGASTSVFSSTSSSLSSRRRLWRVQRASCAWLGGSRHVRVSPKTLPKAATGDGQETARASGVRAACTPTPYGDALGSPRYCQAWRAGSCAQQGHTGPWGGVMFSPFHWDFHDLPYPQLTRKPQCLSGLTQAARRPRSVL